MNRESSSRSAAGLSGLLAAILVLAAGCGGPPPAPAQTKEPPATRPATLTAGTPATARAIDTPTTTAAPSDTPEATAAATEADASPEEASFELPMKGSETAPVTIFEFSDYL